MEQMKADILRRAEEMDLYDDEEDMANDTQDVAFDDELETSSPVKLKVSGDGEETDEEDDAAEDIVNMKTFGGKGKGKETPETSLELAYIQDPTLFDRDAQTRRGKAREGLKAQTGWCGPKTNNIF
jgi:activating signal cointegrator complex subunit 2